MTLPARGSELLDTAYLHRSRQPLGQAPIDHVTRRERTDDQASIFDLTGSPGALDALTDEDELPGCSPFSCRDDGVDLQRESFDGEAS